MEPQITLEENSFYMKTAKSRNNIVSFIRRTALSLVSHLNKTVFDVYVNFKNFLESEFLNLLTFYLVVCNQQTVVWPIIRKYHVSLTKK